MRTFNAQILAAASAFVTILMAASSSIAAAQSTSTASDSADTPQLTEVVVTARRREENLQNVPDAITAFTATSIVDAGIQQISDFAALTPNLIFHESTAYRAGVFDLSMRGIGNGQEGWSSVSYIVDGVPADSLDSIASGTLEDIDRIEVLRGPQSALYGFNALAGAINIITKRPTNDWLFETRTLYGNGDDRQLGATVSGPIIPDKLLFRLTASYRDDDGLIQSTGNGLDLDFKLDKQVQGRLIFTPADNLEIDLRGSFAKQHDGAGYQDRVPTFAYADDFDSPYGARRGLEGYEDRALDKLSARVQWDFEPVSLISVTGFDHIDQHLVYSTCYDNPNDPLYPATGGGDVCLFTAIGLAPPALGLRAPPGTPIDYPYDGEDNFRTVTEDVRLASRGSDAMQWTVGASALYRRYLTGYDSTELLAPAVEVPLPGLSDWNDKHDNWWGVYGQLIWKATERLELSAAARYDDEIYKNAGYTTRAFNTVIPVLSPQGTLENTQRETADAFQPKGQVSYHFTEDVLAYATVSRGFRAGYFISGNYTLPEHTTNYELGLKTMEWNRRILANLAIFHIDYTDQQFESQIAEFPFRSAITIPKTDINGVEYESTLLVSRFVTFGLGLGYLNATVANGGGQSPDTPHFNGNATADFTYPLANQWKARLHLDDRYNSSQYLATGDSQPLPSKNFLNLRAGLQSDHYDITAFVRNATDTREVTIAGVMIPSFGVIRYQNEPRSYGVEFRTKF